jgi:hypothetical protein
MWEIVGRPGYFGRKRDEKIAQLDKTYGKGRWRLVWVQFVEHFAGSGTGTWSNLEFFAACRNCYEESYFQYLLKRPDLVDLACQYTECFDNATTNVESGLDYMKQEAFSTHIQDIALRNVLRRLGRWFEGKNGKLLQIRSKDSEGYVFGPGNIPFLNPGAIIKPSMVPSWAQEGSVEDFWQSNKHILVWND